MKKLPACVLGATAIGLLLPISLVSSGCGSAGGQAPTPQIPRLQGTANPNLSGVWQALNEANWDLEAHTARAARVLHPGAPTGSPVPGAPVLALGATGGIPGSLGVVVGGSIPYKPEALARKKDNF